MITIIVYIEEFADAIDNKIGVGMYMRKHIVFDTSTFLLALIVALGMVFILQFVNIVVMLPIVMLTVSGR